MLRKACSVQQRNVACRVVPRQPTDVNHIHMIKCKSNPLSYSERYPDQMRHYVIGFPSTTLARQVMYNMSPEPSLRLYRRNFDDVTDEVNIGLDDLGCQTVDGSIILDTQALLHIPKKDNLLPEAMNDGLFHLAQITFADFLMFPFENNIGIIMPYYIEKETDYELVLLSNVVESINSTKGFRSKLDKLM